MRFTFDATSRFEFLLDVISTEVCHGECEETVMVFKLYLFIS